MQNATSEFSKKTAAKMDVLMHAIASMRALPDEERKALIAIIEEENKADKPIEVAVEREVSEEVKALAGVKQTAQTVQDMTVFTD